jgi:hydroxymethylpyrimidine pyrophosphatase-like HAD family hydrolase
MINPYRVIFIDIDGTLVGPAGIVSAHAERWWRSSTGG